jgi:hypothetical protein
MEKENVYTHNGILFSHKKKEIFICDNIDEPVEHYPKRSKPGIETQIS